MAGSRLLSPGAIELDLELGFGKNGQAAAALVVEEGGGASLAVGFLDYHVGGGLVAPRGRISVAKGIHVQLGRFDVPFGNDWP